MSCLNPLDPQTIRVFSDEGAFHSCTANSGGGQDRCSILQFAPPKARSVCYENHAQDSRVRLLADDCCPTIGASHAASPDHTPLVHQGVAVAFMIDSDGSNAMKSQNPHSGSRRVEAAPTLTTFDPGPERSHGGLAVVSLAPTRRRAVTVRMRAGKPGGGKGALISREHSLTLSCGNDQTVFCVPSAEVV